jgi:hypothetical protein
MTVSKDTQENSGPIISGSAVISAGLASAGAAAITSRFGVAGTLLGAALTTMIITGGAAILKAYLESAKGKVKGVSGRLRARTSRKARRYEEPAAMPNRPDLRNNFVGRMRASLAWFSRLPHSRRRSILIKGLIAAVVAFLIGMAAIYGTERLIGNSLSCGFWGNCPYGVEPGIHPLGYGGTGAGPSVGPDGSNAVTTPDGTQGSPFGGSDRQNQFFGGGQQQQPSSAQPQGDPSSASASASAQPEEEEDASSASASASAQPQDDSSAPPE